MLEAGLLVAAYVAGAVPFGLLIARAVAGVDVRDHGSGNIGATNVYRVAGPKAGVAAFLLDVLKGLWPPIVAQALGLAVPWQVAGGLAAFAGHSASPFLRFAGGKGIATSLGVLFGLCWPVGVSAWALWGVVLLLWRYVSLASIVAAISLTPFTLLYYPGDPYRLGFVVAAGLIAVFRHRSNIRRLAAGTESRVRRPWEPRREDEPEPTEPAVGGGAGR